MFFDGRGLQMGVGGCNINRFNNNGVEVLEIGRIDLIKKVTNRFKFVTVILHHVFKKYCDKIAYSS